MKDFEKSTTFRKSNGELRKALKSPEKAKQLMSKHGQVGEGDKPQIRIMGDTEKVINKIKEYNLEDQVDGLYKMFKDKDKREEIDPNNIRAYINLPKH